MPLPPPVIRAVLFLNSNILWFWFSTSCRIRSEHQTGLYLVSCLLSLDMGEDGKTELDSPAGTASGNDVSVGHDTFLDVFRSFGLDGLLEAVITGDLLSSKVRKEAEDYTWGSADGCYRTTFPVMFLHDVHKFSEGCEVG